MSNRSRTIVSAMLFLALAVAGAFIVSAMADRGGGGTPGETGLRAHDTPVEDPSSIRVEVLNGAGAAGLARDATHHLRRSGFDVVFFGNAGRFDHPRSFVLDRTGQAERARAVAAALGIDSVRTAVDSSLMLEVTVVLGDDWPPEPVPEPGWPDRIRDLLEGESPAADSAAGAPAGAPADSPAGSASDSAAHPAG